MRDNDWIWIIILIAITFAFEIWLFAEGKELFKTWILMA